MSETIREQIDRARAQEFVTIEQLSLLLQISPKTIRRRIQAGLLPGVVRSGRLVRINRVLAVRGWATSVVRG